MIRFGTFHMYEILPAGMLLGSCARGKIFKKMAGTRLNLTLQNSIIRQPSRRTLRCSAKHNSLGNEGSYATTIRPSGCGSFYDRQVDAWRQKPILSVALGDLYMPSTSTITQEDMIRNAALVREQVAIRLAKRIHKMQMLPLIVGICPHVHTLYTLYCAGFERLIQLPEPTTANHEKHLTETVFPDLLDSAKIVLPTLASASKAIVGLPEDLVPKEEMFSFLDTMLIGRIYRRTLIANHMRLNLISKNRVDEIPQLEGVIEDNCDVVELVHSAWEFTKPICEQRYGRCPELIVNDPQQTICHIKNHIQYMLIELFKNAARATLEFHYATYGSAADEYPIPPIEVTVLPTKHDCTITVKDKGGGIHRRDREKVFEYAYSTWHTDEFHDQTSTDGSKAWPRFQGAQHVIGQGFGLPLIQQYARFFGGQLELMSVIGHGTDAYLRLPDLNPTLPQPQMSPRIDS